GKVFAPSSTTSRASFSLGASSARFPLPPIRTERARLISPFPQGVFMQRRSFLKNATLGAVAGGATLAAPVFAQQAPTINWRLASSFPRSADAIYSGGENVAKYISEATDGKFSIRAFPAGEIVPALAVLDGVQ